MSLLATHLLFKKPDQLYNDLPLLAPTVEIQSKAVLKAAIEAHTALAQLAVTIGYSKF